MKSAVKELEEKARAAKEASRRLAYLSAEVKNKALHNISDNLLATSFFILLSFSMTKPFKSGSYCGVIFEMKH